MQQPQGRHSLCASDAKTKHQETSIYLNYKTKYINGIISTKFHLPPWKGFLCRP